MAKKKKKKTFVCNKCGDRLPMRFRKRDGSCNFCLVKEVFNFTRPSLFSDRRKPLGGSQSKSTEKPK